MKSLFISKSLLLFKFGLIFLFSFQYLLAQQDSTKYHQSKEILSYEVIKSNPAAYLCGPTFITSELGLNYEFSLSKTHSISIGASLLTKNVFIYLAEIIPMAQSTISQHLKALLEAGLIQGKINPPKVRYCIDRENWLKAYAFFDGFFTHDREFRCS